jgi:hypothetical protein
MDEHPLIYFREGASGRRPALLGTRLDVADVIETVRVNDRSVERAAAYLELPVGMAQEQRAIMTNSVKDFLPLVGRAAVAADDHAGLLLTSDRSMPRRGDAIGRFVEALDAFLRRHQGDDACRNRAQWLSGVRERP